jgi:hypothetical protein
MKWTKEGQLAAQDGLCFYCGIKIEGLKRDEASIYVLGTTDHAIPVSKGGLDIPENLVIACFPCNIAKRDRTPAEFLALKIAEAEERAFKKGYAKGIKMGERAFRDSKGNINSVIAHINTLRKQLDKDLASLTALQKTMTELEDAAEREYKGYRDAA